MSTAYQQTAGIIDAAGPPVLTEPGAAEALQHETSEPSQTGAFEQQGQGRGGGSGDDGDLAELNHRCAFRPLTDLGNVERFVARNKGKFLWCPVLGWLAWDGKRWSRDGADGLIEAAVHRTIRAIQDEAEAIAKTEEDFVAVEATRNKDAVRWSDLIKSWGRTSESAGHINCIARAGNKPGLAAPYLAVAMRDLDADPMLINVLNGTLVVRRGPGEEDCVGFRPHDPGDLITKICPVEYLPEATCPLYDAFLAQMQPDEKVRRFLQQWGGLSLTGDITEHKLCFWWGKGRNGKSTLLETWAHVAGDYAGNTPIETFLNAGGSRRGGEATPELAKLPGVRMLRTSEPDKGAKLNEALIKSVTGGDTIDARHLNRDFFSFVPQFKLTIFGNYRPSISGTDDGIWARLQLVPWLVKVEKRDTDKDLAKKLRREASGILNRLLDGLRDWVEHGLVVPDFVVAATEKYRSDSDPLGRFLAACVRHAPGRRVQSSEMHKVFCAWGKASGEREWTATGLGRALAERGYVSKQSNVMWWLDVELAKGVDDFVDHEGKPIRVTEEKENGDDVFE